MIISMAVDFGKCPCGGLYETRSVEINKTTGSQESLLSHVLQGVCPECSSQVYKAETLEYIEYSLKEQPIHHKIAL